jgi:ABC-2 type transport system permease protein
MRLLRANLRKLIRRPATWVTFILLVALLGLIFLAVIASSRTSQDPQAALAARLFVTFPGAYQLVVTLILGIGGLLAVTYGAAIAGSEWTWGTLKAAVARGEGRSAYTLLNYASIAVFTLVGLLLTFAIGVATSALGAVILDVPLSGMTDTDGLTGIPELLGRAGLALSMNAAFGFAIATIARSQLAGIGVGIGLYFAEGIAGIFLPDVIQWFPFAASSAVAARTGAGSFGENGGGGLTTQLDPNTAVIVVVVWLIVALGVSSLFTERAEIGG